MSIKKQQGFTLIELIAVVVILGILAAIAIPRYASLSQNARFASIKGLSGALAGASSLAHSLYLANGSSGSSVTMDGAAVTLANGYPDATATGISVAVPTATTDYTFTAGSGASAATFCVAGNATCCVSYLPATSSASPVITPPAQSSC